MSLASDHSYCEFAHAAVWLQGWESVIWRKLDGWPTYGLQSRQSRQSKFFDGLTFWRKVRQISREPHIKVKCCMLTLVISMQHSISLQCRTPHIKKIMPQKLTMANSMGQRRILGIKVCSVVFVTDWWNWRIDGILTENWRKVIRHVIRHVSQNPLTWPFLILAPTTSWLMARRCPSGGNLEMSAAPGWSRSIYERVEQKVDLWKGWTESPSMKKGKLDDGNDRSIVVQEPKE